jgi:hypothetical protein
LTVPQQSSRPFLVTAIAWFEMVRAGLILLIALSPLPGGTDLATNPAAQVATINLMSVEDFVHYDFAGQMDNKPHISDAAINTSIKAVLALPFAVPFVILGAGLLQRRKWARGYTAATSVGLVLFWIRGLAIYWTVGNADVSSAGISQSLYTIGLALVLNGFIFLYLMFGYGVASTFEQKR